MFQAAIPRHGKSVTLSTFPDYLVLGCSRPPLNDTLSGRHFPSWTKPKRYAEQFSRPLYCGVFPATILRHGKDIALGTFPEYCVLGCSRPPCLVLGTALRCALFQTTVVWSAPGNQTSSWKKRYAEHFSKLLCFRFLQATIPGPGRSVTLSGRHPLSWKK